MRGASGWILEKNQKINVIVSPLASQSFFNFSNISIINESSNSPLSTHYSQYSISQEISPNEIKVMINNEEKFHPEFLLTWKRGPDLLDRNYAQRSF